MFDRKPSPLSVWQVSTPQNSVTWTRRRILSLLLLPIACFLLLLRSDLRDGDASQFFRNPLLVTSDQSTSGKSFRWSELSPSIELEWNDCYDSFQCAKLDLPLDWLDPSNDTRISLALIRLEASEKDGYQGPLFVNPGGPSGSGISTVMKSGKAIQTIVGKNHDIIGFDPRGVGLSTPRLNCFPTLRSIQLWTLFDVDVIDAHPGVLYDAFARATAYSSSCNAALGGFNNSEVDHEPQLNSENSRNVMAAGPGRFVSTASVARDMLEILNKGGWEKMRYYGYSYGTVIGGTFAAMFPDRVERMVNDGNVNLMDWTTLREHHLSLLQDADAVMEAFYKYCHSSGPLLCAFYAPSPLLIENRLDSLLNNFKAHPLIVPGALTTEGTPLIISYSWVKRLISAALYRPVLLFPVLAEILATLEKGDGLPFMSFTEKEGFRIPFTPDTDCGNGSGGEGGGGSEVLDFEPSLDPFKTIMCTDGGEMNDTPEEFEKFAKGLMNVSKSAGAVQAQMFRMACAGWKVKAKWRYTGPFTGNTSHPILFIANSADNVTPLASALNNSAGFPGSAVLVQEAFGHTSLTAPSICTASHIRAYFQYGILPEPGTRCKSDIEPFQIGSDRPGENETLVVDMFGDATKEVEEALMHLMRSTKVGF